MASEPFFHRPLRFAAGWLFTIYHDIRVSGAEHLPPAGAAIVAANHPTYLDPAFLMVGLRRPIRFMAWEKPFRIPLLGAMMRAYGAIPVDTKRPGRASFEAAVRVLKGGEVFGIFPEGGRTRGMEPMNPFKSGVARLALITGAPIIPATIRGGARVWRRGDLLPKPGPIEVVFHPPIRVAASERRAWRRDKGLERALIERLMAEIAGSLLPAVRREERLGRLLEGPPSPPQPSVEGVPIAAAALAALVLPSEAWGGVVRPALLWALAYLGALVLELALEARGSLAIWIRHLLPWLTLAAIRHGSLGTPGPAGLAAEAAAAACLAWLLFFRFPLYRRARAALLLAAYGAWLAAAAWRVPWST